MQLSTRGRYAVMAMLDLAELSRNRATPVTLAEIAERQMISLSYLEQLFAKLRKNGVVESVRGPGGGYRIAKPLNLVWLSDIIGAVDEIVDVTRCGEPDRKTPREGHGCIAGRKCNTHDVWSALGRHVEDFMRRVNIQMVLNGEITDGFSMLGEHDEAIGESILVKLNG
jgi:Rrf2 family transcriptional regulator, iron-sulfur cluster assembly transcription factor